MQGDESARSGEANAVAVGKHPGRGQAGAWMAVVLTGACAVLALAVLDPGVLYSGDTGVVFVQTGSLLARGLRSLALEYPGAMLDAAGAFFPFRPPHIFTVGAGVQAIFPPAGVIIHAPFVAVAGIAGMVIPSIIGAGLTLWAASRLGRRPGDWRLPAVLALGTPLWFYAATGLDHAPAVGLSTTALWLAASRGRSVTGALAAGAVLGLGGALRDEILLLLPGLAIAVWLAGGRWAALAAALGGAAAPLALFGAIEVWWFDRPLMSHLRHAAHLLRSAIHLTATPNLEVPMLAPMSWRGRYDTIVQYWLVGGLADWIVAAVVVAILAAWVLRRRRTASWLVLGLAAGIFGACAWQIVGLVPAPRWVAGLFRLSPFIIFALLPLPARLAAPAPDRRVLLAGSVLFVAIAFLGIDTTGGKSLGPRLLLPIVPILTVAAWQSIAAWGRSDAPVDRAAGRVGLALVAVSLAMHLLVAIPAYAGRNRDDRAALDAVRTSGVRVVVTDNTFTAQLVSPLYFRKVIMLAGGREAGARLAASLHRQGVPEILFVSREDDPQVTLEPYRIAHSGRQGRMLVQRWRR